MKFNLEDKDFLFGLFFAAVAGFCAGIAAGNALYTVIVITGLLSLHWFTRPD